MSEETKLELPQTASIRPLGKLLADAWGIYIVILGRAVKLMLVPLLALIPLAMVVTVGLFFNRFFDSSDMRLVNGMAVMGLAAFCLIAVAVLSVISQAGVYALVRDQAQNPGVREAWREGKRFAWRYFGVNVAASVLILLWTLLFVIPGIIASIYYSLALWALFYEDFSGSKALKRSKELVKGHWWAVMSRFLAPSLIIYGLAVLPEAALSEGWFRQASGALAMAISVISGPYFAALGSLIYWDLVGLKGPSKMRA